MVAKSGSNQESRYNNSMKNKIDLIKGAKTIIVSDISGVDFDLRKGDVIVFDGMDERPEEENGNEWKEDLADEVDGDISRLKGVMVTQEADNYEGWFPIDTLTNTILSY